MTNVHTGQVQRQTLLEGSVNRLGSAKINFVIFSPDSQMILTTPWLDKTATFWDLQGREITVLRGHTELVTSASFAPDSKKNSHGIK